MLRKSPPKCAKQLVWETGSEKCSPQREGQLEVRLYVPLVLAVEAQGVKSNRLAVLRREALEVNATISVKEAGQRRAIARTDRPNSWIEVANVIAPEADSKLQRVVSLRYGKVIHELVLAHIPTLRYDSQEISQGGKCSSGEADAEWQSLLSCLEIVEVKQ